MRKIIKGGLAATAAAVLSVGIMATSAQADPAFVPDANDAVFVGSDTSQFLYNQLAEGNSAGNGWNDTNPAVRVASWDAVNPTTGNPGDSIVVRSGSAAITRPNGSSQGIARLMGAGNLPAITGARSSRSITAAEAAAPNNLRQIPIARDGLRVVGNKSQTGSPANLTAAQLWRIYECQATFNQWSEVGGTSTATIVPIVPQTGSGTRTFFLDQLAAAKGSAVVLGACVQTAQEHDPDPVIANVNALSPFSLGRFNTLPAAQKNAIKVFGSFVPSRVLYTVVRLADVSNANLTPILGPSGFFCGASGDAIVTAAGFQVLTSGCGVARTTPLP